MNPPAQSTDAEIEALDRLCERLSGFGAEITLERLDGALTALVAGPREPAADEWLPLLFGDAWARAIADPEDLAQAMATLARRRAVIADQLAPRELFDEPDELRLMPIIDEFDPDQRDELLAAGRIDAAAAWPLTGEDWAIGFLDIVDRLPQDWQLPPGAAGRAELETLLQTIGRLAERAGPGADRASRARTQPPTRDELLDDACFAVQDLRCFWLEQRTRPLPRQVEKRPGRNDPCPCGSGLKFKKCHGAAGGSPRA